jgi:hypothetical protein
MGNKEEENFGEGGALFVGLNGHNSRLQLTSTGSGWMSIMGKAV